MGTTENVKGGNEQIREVNAELLTIPVMLKALVHENATCMLK